MRSAQSFRFGSEPSFLYAALSGQVVFKNNFAAGVAVLRSENLSQNDTGADVILLV